MAKRTTGVLLSIGGAEFARSYTQLQNCSRALQADARGLAYWADGHGGGRFTPIAAAACVVFIQDTIDGKHPEITNQFQSLDHRYEKWKNNLGYGSHPWKRTGKTRDSFTVSLEKLGKKSMGVVTIDPDATTPRMTYGKGGSASVRGQISAATVFKWLEFGTTKMAARPLVGAAIRRFVVVNFPKMTDAVDRALVKWAKKSHGSITGATQGVGSMVDVMGKATRVSSIEELASVNVQSDFSDAQIKEAFSQGAVSTDKVYEAELAAMDRELYGSLKESGIDESEIKRIMDGMKGV